MRSGGHDQAQLIAGRLNMNHHFHPAMRLAEESFGDAILSTYPMRLIKAQSLSRSDSSSLEPRGALWVELDMDGSFVQVINTHLGLDSKERLRHTIELLSGDWIGGADCTGPVILCGDLNTLPGSRVFRLLDERLKSVQGKGLRHLRTWYGRYPLACLDYIFVSPEAEVLKAEIGDSHLARLASDHRPLVAELRIVQADTAKASDTAQSTKYSV
jgi:endonuclease/exonuclease/phosphatase family metal-dependent hydrolase